MTQDNARRVANVIVAAAGVTLAIVVVSQPRLRRMLWRLAPVALRQVRPIHVVAALAALSAPAAAVAAPAVAEAVASSSSEPPRARGR